MATKTKKPTKLVTKITIDVKKVVKDCIKGILENHKDWLDDKEELPTKADRQEWVSDQFYYLVNETEDDGGFGPAAQYLADEHPAELSAVVHAMILKIVK